MKQALNESKSKEIALMIKEQKPEYFKGLVDDFMTNYSYYKDDFQSKFVNGFKSDISYDLEQKFGVCCGMSELNKIVEEILSLVAKEAAKQGYTGYMFQGEDDEKEAQDSELERISEEYKVADFVEYLKRPSDSKYFDETGFELLAEKLYGDKKANKAEILNSIANSYSAFNGEHRYYSKMDKIPGYIKDILKIILKKYKPELKQAFIDAQMRSSEKENAKNPGETKEAIQESFKYILNKLLLY